MEQEEPSLSPGRRLPPSPALPPEPTRAAKRRRDPRSLPQGGAWAGADTHLAKHNLHPNRAAAAGPGGSRDGGWGIGRLHRGTQDHGAACAPLPEGAGEQGGHTAASSPRAGRPPKPGSSTARPGAPASTFSPSRALALPGPAPDTHLRRLRAGRTSASQLQLRAESTREKQDKKGPWFGVAQMDGT